MTLTLGPMEIDGFIQSASGQRRPFRLQISEPRATGKGTEHACLIACPALFASEKRIFGVDAEQARELAIDFVRLLLGDQRLVDETGRDIPFSELLRLDFFAPCGDSSNQLLEPGGLDVDQLRRALTAQRFGALIEAHSAIDSTNTEAMRRAREGAPEGTVVLADRQHRGRGRLGRQWVSPPGCNLYCSIVTRPTLPPAEVPLLTLVAGVAVAETVGEFVSDGVAIKWPNDIVIHGRKVAGILAEMETEATGALFVVVGIGINVNAAPGDFPPEVRGLATSVAIATGYEVSREVVCGHLLSRFETRYDLMLGEGFGRIVPLWEKWDGLRGRQIRVRDGSALIEGRAAGIEANGLLRVETAEGLAHIVAGDVSVIDGYKERR